MLSLHRGLTCLYVEKMPLVCVWGYIIHGTLLKGWNQRPFIHHFILICLKNKINYFTVYRSSACLAVLCCCIHDYYCLSRCRLLLCSWLLIFQGCMFYPLLPRCPTLHTPSRACSASRIMQEATSNFPPPSPSLASSGTACLPLFSTSIQDELFGEGNILTSRYIN